LEHGAIDVIVHRKQLRDRISALINKLMHRFGEDYARQELQDNQELA